MERRSLPWRLLALAVVAFSIVAALTRPRIWRTDSMGSAGVWRGELDPVPHSIDAGAVAQPQPTCPAAGAHRTGQLQLR